MSDFKEGMAAALVKMVSRYVGDCVEVIDWEDEQKFEGYCETCFYEWTVVNITYKDSEGFTKEFEYSGSTAELLRELSDGLY